MRKLSFLLALAVMILSQACAQQKEAPTKVKNSFTQKFPNAKKVKWDKENATEWEAEFKMNGKEYSANFNSDGTWKETEYKIKKSEIPAVVKQTLNSQFAGYDIEKVEVSKKPEGLVYELKLEKDDTDMEVAISSNGKVLKKESKNEEKEEEGEEGGEENDND